MYIETDRTIIRSIQRGDEKAYAEMAKDGSLSEIGFIRLDTPQHSKRITHVQTLSCEIMLYRSSRQT